MRDDIDLTLLDRYLAGECSPAEEAEIARQRSRHPAYDQLIGALIQARASGAAMPSDTERRAAWARLQRDISISEPPTVLRPRRRHAVSPWLKTAAVIALAVSGGLLWRATLDMQRGPAISQVMNEVVTAAGERMEIQLGDGIRVVLSVDSRLRYADPPVREVFLEGEAFFDVVHDPGRPFRVRTATSISDDIGTEFNVREYPGVARVQVAVVSGRVALRSAADTMGSASVLERGQVGVLSDAGEIRILRDADINALIGWTEGRLVFDRTPFAEVVRDLSRWYDIEIQLGDSALGKRPVTATLTDQPADEVLDLLSLALDVSYERIGRSVVFRPR